MVTQPKYSEATPGNTVSLRKGSVTSSVLWALPVPGGLQSDPRPWAACLTVTCGAWGSAGSGARLGSLGGSQLRPRLPHVQQAPPSSVPGPREWTVHGSTASGQGFRPVCHTTEGWTALTGSNSMSFLEGGSRGLGDGSNQQPRLACRVEAVGPVLAAGRAHPCPPQQTVPRGSQQVHGDTCHGCLILEVLLFIEGLLTGSS